MVAPVCIDGGITINAGKSVTGYCDLGGVCFLTNNGTITAWHGNVAALAATKSVDNTTTGTITAWYGDVITSDVGIQQGSDIGIFNAGLITAWYGNVTCTSSNGAAIGNYYTAADHGVITAWYGNILNTDNSSCIYSYGIAT